VETRYMRLGLCTKGFNPFGSFVVSYSCWLVILTIYNLPPGICMRPKFIFLSTVIPDPNSSGQNIDVYLQPLLLNDKEIFILLLWCELVLLCCVCNCEFKYLQDEYIKNTNIIWNQKLFYTDRNNDRLYIIWGYTSGMCLSVYSNDYENCSSSPWYYSWYSLIWIYRWNFSVSIF
jgi:hypothetical protein